MFLWDVSNHLPLHTMPWSEYNVNMNAIFGYMLDQHTPLSGNMSGDINTVSTWTGVIQMGWVHSHYIFLASVIRIQRRKTLAMVICFDQTNKHKKKKTSWSNHPAPIAIFQLQFLVLSTEVLTGIFATNWKNRGLHTDRLTFVGLGASSHFHIIL